MYNLEDGHVRIANELLEDICRLHLSGNCASVVFWAIRNSYGYNRKNTIPASISDIANSVNLSRSSVQFSVDFLQKIGLLKKLKNGAFFFDKYAVKKALTVRPTVHPNCTAHRTVAVRPTVQSVRPTVQPNIYKEERQSERQGEKDNIKAPPSSSASRSFSEADVLAVSKAYCEAKKITFKTPQAFEVYLREDFMRKSAGKFLIMNNGDVERAKLCLKDFADGGYYEGKNWNWKFIMEDFPIWDGPRREYERRQQQRQLEQSGRQGKK